MEKIQFAWEDKADRQTPRHSASKEDIQRIIDEWREWRKENPISANRPYLHTLTMTSTPTGPFNTGSSSIPNNANPVAHSPHRFRPISRDLRPVSNGYSSERLGARSLFQQAKAQVIRNIGQLVDAGDTPVQLLLPILRHVKDPEQLAELEENSPQLKGETGDLWMALIKRDVPSWNKFMFSEPRANGKCWTEEELKPKLAYRHYERLVRRQEEEDQKTLDILRSSTLNNEKEQQAKKLVILETMPQLGPRKRAGGSGSHRPTNVSAASKALAKIRKINAEKKALYGGPKFLSSTIRRPTVPKTRPMGTPLVSQAAPLKRKIGDIAHATVATDIKRRKQAAAERPFSSDDSGDQKPQVMKTKGALTKSKADRPLPASKDSANPKAPAQNSLSKKIESPTPPGEPKTTPAALNGAPDRQKQQPRRKRPAPAIMLPNRRPR
jgi:hypothetical protein